MLSTNILWVLNRRAKNQDKKYINKYFFLDETAFRAISQKIEIDFDFISIHIFNHNINYDLHQQRNYPSGNSV